VQFLLIKSDVFVCGKIFLLYSWRWLHRSGAVCLVTGRRTVVHSLPGGHSTGNTSPAGPVCRQGGAVTWWCLTDVHSRPAQRAASCYMVPWSLL